jgi:hypothetical protein
METFAREHLYLPTFATASAEYVYARYYYNSMARLSKHTVSLKTET